MKLQTLYSLINIHSSRSSKIASRITLITIGVGVFVMILSMSVISGYRNAILGSITTTMGDITVSARGFYMGKKVGKSLAEDSMLVNSVLNSSVVKTIYPYLATNGVLSSGNNLHPVLFRGVSSDDFETLRIREHIVLQDSNSLHNGIEKINNHINPTLLKDNIILSSSLADKLGVTMGDELSTLLLESGILQSSIEVGSLFSTTIEELDNSIVFVPLSWLNNLMSDNPHFIDGYIVELEDGVDREMAILEVKKIVGSRRFKITSILSDYPHLIDWLILLDNNIMLILVIVSFVVGINIISSVLISILENTRKIGIFLSLGMRTSTLQYIFMVKIFKDNLKGILVGVIFGLTFCLFQQYTEFIRLDPDGYIVSYVPINISLFNVLVVITGAFLLTTLFSFLPTYILSRIEPYKTIKYQ